MNTHTASQEKKNVHTVASSCINGKGSPITDGKLLLENTERRLCISSPLNLSHGTSALCKFLQPATSHFLMLISFIITWRKNAMALYKY